MMMYVHMNHFGVIFEDQLTGKNTILPSDITKYQFKFDLHYVPVGTV